MRQELFSELRTMYETTTDNPRTFRLTVKLKDMVDEDVLVDAVRKTMERYPYFCVRLVDDDNKLYFEDNPEPMPIIHADEPITLGSSEAAGHFLVFCWWKNKVHIDICHALTDGGGIYPLVKTFLYYYCSAYYGKELSTEDIRLAGDIISPDEWTDPGRMPLEIDECELLPKWNQPAFQIADGGIAHITQDCIVYNIRINESEFMQFNFSNEGSPATIVALLLSRAIASLHPEMADPPVIAMCVNQRKALRTPLPHQSLVGDCRLVHHQRLAHMDFKTQETCYRGMVVVQTSDDMVRREVQEYQELMDELNQLPTHEARHERCMQLSDEKSEIFTATVSYVGKSSFGDAEYYMQEFHVLPSTALPSCTTPLTLELSAVNGSFYVNFMQFFEEDAYLRSFIAQLRENNINYDVLYQERTKYPGMSYPWL